MDRKKILVADDEPTILKFLAAVLDRAGFVVTTATNGREALEEYKNSRPDLIILDVMMPKMDGFEVCHKIREESSVPIIFLTAKKDTVNKITGLSLGSDDYLTKPFDSVELLLRIHAILRRSIDNSDERGNKKIIKVQGLVLNRASRVVEVNGVEVDLTPKEFDLLWLLASHPNLVFTKDQLIYQIWDTKFCENTGIVTTLVKRLREKIEGDHNNPLYIKTIRGVGYKFGVKPC